MHVKTMFYSYKLNGDEPPEENELILDKKQQKIQDILETVVQMRKGVATAAFMEDVVSLKFAIENLETQYADLQKFDDLQDSVAKQAVESGLQQALIDLREIAKLCGEYNRVLHNGYSQSHASMVVHKDIIRHQIQSVKNETLARLVDMQNQFAKLESEL